ncbi:hypothetical protein [Streptomyces jumonjinensis]|uniref:hypothetical protein n=1 Tax=Streptomyces jumonjinensis TaxID=1945 RepID=UPI0037A6C4CD
MSGWGDDLTQILQRVLARTIPMLPPGRRLEFLLDDQERFNNRELPTAYTFTVESEGPGGTVEPLQYVVDFGTWADSLMKNRPTKRIEDRLGNIEKAAKAFSKNYLRADAPAIRAEQQRRTEMTRQRIEARANSVQPPPATPE